MCCIFSDRIVSIWIADKYIRIKLRDKLMLKYASPDSKVQGANMGPSGSCRPQMGPMLAPWTLLPGSVMVEVSVVMSVALYGNRLFSVFIVMVIPKISIKSYVVAYIQEVFSKNGKQGQFWIICTSTFCYNIVWYNSMWWLQQKMILWNHKRNFITRPHMWPMGCL